SAVHICDASASATRARHDRRLSVSATVTPERVELTAARSSPRNVTIDSAVRPRGGAWMRDWRRGNERRGEGSILMAVAIQVDFTGTGATLENYFKSLKLLGTVPEGQHPDKDCLFHWITQTIPPTPRGCVSSMSGRRRGSFWISCRRSRPHP